MIERINDTPVLRLRDRLLPLVSLADLLAPGDADRRPRPATPSSSSRRSAPTMLGIIVDRVFDTEEIVVKPVAPILRHITMFSGNTILGDGSVIMILDPNGIARATGDRRRRRNPQPPPGDAVETAAFRRAHRDAAVPRRIGAEQMAVPLGLVARLEDIPRDKIETVRRRAGHAVPRQADAAGLAVRRDRSGASRISRCWCSPIATARMGLMVDEIIDVVEDRLDIELCRRAARPAGHRGDRRRTPPT